MTDLLVCCSCRSTLLVQIESSKRFNKCTVLFTVYVFEHDTCIAQLSSQRATVVCTFIASVLFRESALFCLIKEPVILVRACASSFTQAWLQVFHVLVLGLCTSSPGSKLYHFPRLFLSSRDTHFLLVAAYKQLSFPSSKSQSVFTVPSKHFLASSQDFISPKKCIKAVLPVDCHVPCFCHGNILSRMLNLVYLNYFEDPKKRPKM